MIYTCLLHTMGYIIEVYYEKIYTYNTIQWLLNDIYYMYAITTKCYLILCKGMHLLMTYYGAMMIKWKIFYDDIKLLIVNKDFLFDIYYEITYTC